MDVHVGTSGWSYDHWRNGVFYPEGLGPRHWLGHYATAFGTVEVNAPFYRLPTTKTVQGWAAGTPPAFLFTMKMWGLLTHRWRLAPPPDRIAMFGQAIDRIPRSRRAALLIQVPPGLHRDAALLDRFLDRVAQEMPSRWPLAVEFRHRSWYSDDILGLLDAHDAACVVHDMPGSRTEEENGTRLVYVRRHGPDGRYKGRYGAAGLQGDAERILHWAASGRRVLCYFNNDQFGHAVRDALDLKGILAEGVDGLPRPSVARPRSRPARPTPARGSAPRRGLLAPAPGTS